jgi:hypothetical protein
VLFISGIFMTVYSFSHLEEVEFYHLGRKCQTKNGEKFSFSGRGENSEVNIVEVEDETWRFE